MHGKRHLDAAGSGEAERRRAAYASAIREERFVAHRAEPARPLDLDALRCQRCRDLAHPCTEHARLIVELL